MKMKNVHIRRNWFPVSIIYVVLLMVCMTGNLYGQQDNKIKQLFEQAQTLYEKENYQQAISVCNEALQLDSTLVGFETIAANAYSELENYTGELQHLNKALKLSDHPYVKWRLGECNYNLGNYSEALHYYQSYQTYEYISEKRRLILSCKMSSCMFQIMGLSAQTVSQESNTGEENPFWPELSQDGKKLLFMGKQDDLNQLLTEGDGLGPEILADSLTQPFASTEEGPAFYPTWQKNGILFFVGVNREDSQGDTDIYFSQFKEGKWSIPQNAGEKVNSPSKESLPFYDHVSKSLFFSSNRPGGKGGMDIWRIGLSGDVNNDVLQWGIPENLSELNTEGNEISPYLNAKTGMFYFASDNYGGLGGYDLYEAELERSGTSILNLGYPINTEVHELGLLVHQISDTAFFASAREKGNGLEIFTFNLDRGLRSDPNFYIDLNVADQSTGKPVSAKVEIESVQRTTDSIRVVHVNKNGKCFIRLRANRDYLINVTGDGYLFDSELLVNTRTNKVEEPHKMEFALTPIEVGAEVNLYNIYFNPNSAELLPNSRSELERLVSFLHENKDVRLEIQGHTDSTGTPENNQVLSEERAKSVVDYLLDKQVDTPRLSHAGYGDTRPVASNETEEGRRQNRRTTIRIVGK